MPVAVFRAILETIHSAIKMLASRTVFTRDIVTTIWIQIRSGLIIFHDFIPTIHSAITMLASRTVFTEDILATIWILIRSGLGLVGSGIIFPVSKPT
jgi:hypothetical protein